MHYSEMWMLAVFISLVSILIWICLCTLLLIVWTASMLQDVAIERGPGALALLRSADAGCLRLTCLRLNLDLSLRAAIDLWTVSVTHKPYALDPDFDL